MKTFRYNEYKIKLAVEFFKVLVRKKFILYFHKPIDLQ